MNVGVVGLNREVFSNIFESDSLPMPEDVLLTGGDNRPLPYGRIDSTASDDCQ